MNMQHNLLLSSYEHVRLCRAAALLAAVQRGLLLLRRRSSGIYHQTETLSGSCSPVQTNIIHTIRALNHTPIGRSRAVDAGPVRASGVD